MTPLAWLAAAISVILMIPSSLRLINGSPFVTVDGRETVDLSILAGAAGSSCYSAVVAWGLWSAVPASDPQHLPLAIALSSCAMGIVTLLGMIRACTSPYRTPGGY